MFSGYLDNLCLKHMERKKLFFLNKKIYHLCRFSTNSKSKFGGGSNQSTVIFLWFESMVVYPSKLSRLCFYWYVLVFVAGSFVLWHVLLSILLCTSFARIVFLKYIFWLLNKTNLKLNKKWNYFSRLIYFKWRIKNYYL